MSRQPSRSPPPAQQIAAKVFSTLERFLHVEAVSGVVLLVAAAAALIWANSPAAASYEHLWHTPITLGIGTAVVDQPLHFWINDGLMTIFFLVVGMEIRREIHEGALADLQSAALPFAAAAGGVLIPAVIYVGLNAAPQGRAGWAVPTATDIAFAVGVLALLGRSVPGPVRAFLLALAIIDDVVAVLIIALFYSAGLALSGLWMVAGGMLLTIGLQRIGIRSAFAYVIPGAILWWGMLKTGIHPTLAGVVLGLMTPAQAMRGKYTPVEAATRALQDLDQHAGEQPPDPHTLAKPLRQLKEAQLDLLAPVVRVQMALHPWVAYVVMPLFALANAGVSVQGMGGATATERGIALGVIAALVIGKPAGIVLGSWLAVRMRWARLAPDMSWEGVLLVGCLGGIGFTMSIFIATLAFADASLLAAAKLGVLVASAVAGIAGLLVGRHYTRQREAHGKLRTRQEEQARP